MAIYYNATPAFKMIDNYIYFYHLDKFCVLPTYPDSITDNVSTKFAEQNALSRSAPVFSYIQSGPRTMTIQFDLHRDMMNDLNRNVSNLKDNVVDFSGTDYVDTLIKYLQAAALPKYQAYASGSKSVIPPMVAIRFGSEIFIKGVITSGIQVTYKRPILYNDKYALISVSFTVAETEPFDADSVAAEGSFRGITSSFRNGIYNSTDSDNMSGTDIDLTNWVTSSGSSDTTIQNNRNITWTKRKSNTHESSSGVIHGGGGSHSFATTEAETPAVDKSNPSQYLSSYCWQYGTTGPYSKTVNTQASKTAQSSTPTDGWSGGTTSPYAK